jgi:hypothetical protein
VSARRWIVAAWVLATSMACHAGSTRAQGLALTPASLVGVCCTCEIYAARPPDFEHDEALARFYDSQSPFYASDGQGVIGIDGTPVELGAIDSKTGLESAADGTSVRITRSDTLHFTGAPGQEYDEWSRVKVSVTRGSERLEVEAYEHCAVP